MKTHIRLLTKSQAGMLCLGMLLLDSGLPVQACSIFVLADGKNAIFGNNEDWSDPRPRIWFVPGAVGDYGCAFVGFRNHWAQGGLNSKGLAFDWVAGFKEDYTPPQSLQATGANPSEQMLKTCATVEEAIRFYEQYKEPSFSYARILVADSTGASVVISAKDGKLQFEKSARSRGFGFGGQTLEKKLASNPAPTPENAGAILRECLQTGRFATKYSNVYDLKSREIFLYPTPTNASAVELSLDAELKKGEHYYEMARIREQITQPPTPWPTATTARPLPDTEPKVTARMRSMLQDTIEGKPKESDYATNIWPIISSKREDYQQQLKSFGDLGSVVLVERGELDGNRAYWYRIDFANASLLQRCVFDANDRVMDGETEDFHQK